VFVYSSFLFVFCYITWKFLLRLLSLKFSSFFLSFFLGFRRLDLIRGTGLRPKSKQRLSLCLPELLLVLQIIFSRREVRGWGLPGEGVEKNPSQIWAYLFGILFNSFPIFIPNFGFFFLSYTNSWGKYVKHSATMQASLFWGISKSPKKKEEVGDP